MKFVLNASATPKTLKIFVNDEQKGSRDLTRWDDYVDIVDTLTAASMRLGGNWSEGNIQNLNAQIRNLNISGVRTDSGYVLRGTPTEAGEHLIVLSATDSEALPGTSRRPRASSR